MGASYSLGAAVLERSWQPLGFGRGQSGPAPAVPGAAAHIARAVGAGHGLTSRNVTNSDGATVPDAARGWPQATAVQPPLGSGTGRCVCVCLHAPRAHGFGGSQRAVGPDLPRGAGRLCGHGAGCTGAGPCHAPVVSIKQRSPWLGQPHARCPAGLPVNPAGLLTPVLTPPRRRCHPRPWHCTGVLLVALPCCRCRARGALLQPGVSAPSCSLTMSVEGGMATLNTGL